MSNEKSSILLWLPKELKAAIQKRAEKNRRSATMEIVSILSKEIDPEHHLDVEADFEAVD